MYGVLPHGRETYSVVDKEERQQIEAFKISECHRGLTKVSWADRVTNEDILNLTH